MRKPVPRAALCIVVAVGVVAAGARQAPGVGKPPALHAPVGAGSAAPRANLGEGISVSGPRGRHVFLRPLTRVVSPAQRGVLTSFPLDQTQPDAGCAPATAMRQMPNSGAWVYVIEYSGQTRQLLSTFPPK